MRSIKNSPLDKGYYGSSIYKISDEGLSQLEDLDQKEKERLAALEQPLTPEEEASLQSADELPPRSTVEMPGEEEPEAIAVARQQSRNTRDLLNRGMFGVNRRGVAEGKNLKVKKKK